jgi:hypothetical protein
LTPGEEAGLMKYIYNQIFTGYLYTGPIILDLVHHFQKLQDPTAKPPSSRFLQDLVQQHPEIYSITSKPIDTKRKAVHDKSVIKPWYKVLDQLVDQYNCSLYNLLNFDEIGECIACPAGIAVNIPVQYKNIRNIV